MISISDYVYVQPNICLITLKGVPFFKNCTVITNFFIVIAIWWLMFTLSILHMAPFKYIGMVFKFQPDTRASHFLCRHVPYPSCLSFQKILTYYFISNFQFWLVYQILHCHCHLVAYVHPIATTNGTIQVHRHGFQPDTRASHFLCCHVPYPSCLSFQKILLWGCMLFQM